MITDRFSRAAEQLGREQLDVRLGGIYSLERIARESPDDHPQIVEILTAFIRERARRGRESVAEKAERDSEQTSPPVPGGVPTGPLPSDIQAAFTVLGRRNPDHDGNVELNLMLADLRLVTGKEVDLAGARLAFADMRYAHLYGARLEKADFLKARLDGAVLAAARARGAEFFQTSMAETNLQAADLRFAQFTGAGLRGVSFVRADLRHATFYRSADLRDSALYRAHLEGTDLADAILDDSTKLEGAVWDEETSWPSGFEPRIATGTEPRPRTPIHEVLDDERRPWDLTAD